jgi:hypothetical protein
LTAWVLTGAAAQAHAETRRMAVVIGSNRGDSSHAPLRFAEQDAAKLASVLTELGGVAAADVLLLRGPSVADVRTGLDDVTRRIAGWHAEHRGQVVLVFYFSGHSDGAMLELAGQGLPFAEVRRRLTATGADVRLVILDSCRSGALLALKGGTLGQPFDIRLADELASTGEAMIASSASDEAALESSEIEASFFSHHLISGLRGAADSSGDGVVTLAEAYQYAFARTLRTTAETTVGPQHPAYDYRLAGRGDLVLTRLLRPSSVLSLPDGFERVLLVSTGREQVLAELGVRSARRIAVSPGTYQVRAWKGGHSFGKRVTVAQGQELSVTADELAPMLVGPAFAKGSAADETVFAAATASVQQAPRPWSLSLSLGASDGISEDAVLAGGRLGLQRAFGNRRLALTLSGATGRAPGMRENRVAAAILPSWWVGGGRVRAGLGLAVGGGIAFERTDLARNHFSGLAYTSPTLALEIGLDDRLSLQAIAELPLALLRRDDRLTVIALPSAWFGLSRAF